MFHLQKFNSSQVQLSLSKFGAVFVLQFTLDCTIATNYTDIVQREGFESLTTSKVYIDGQFLVCGCYLTCASFLSEIQNSELRRVICLQALQLSALPHVSQKCSIKLDLRSREKKTRLSDLGC
jgi:hypothetical protein